MFYKKRYENLQKNYNDLLKEKLKLTYQNKEMSDKIKYLEKCKTTIENIRLAINNIDKEDSAKRQHEALNKRRLSSYANAAFERE